MNLIEVLMAALLFSLSAGSSLRILSQTTLGVMQEERRQQLRERLDGELAVLEASLRRLARQTPQPPPCGNTAASLRAQLSSLPSTAGVLRQLSLLPGQDGLLLELALEDLPVRRQRLVLPAALGLCQPSVATQPPQAPSLHG